jgi:hypothetical protein
MRNAYTRLTLVAISAVLLISVAATSTAATGFTYKYKVTEVVIRGFFKANVDDGEGNTLTAEETVDVFALGKGEKCPGGPGKCPLLRSGSLTLRHPPTAQNPIGILQTAIIPRKYVINAVETNGSGQRFDCGKTFSDSDRFSGLLAVSKDGKRVSARWNFPTAPIICRQAGGSQSVDLKEMNDFQAQQLYGEIYPISLFRRATVTLELKSEYEWKPNETTKLRGELAGYVELKRL